MVVIIGTIATWVLYGARITQLEKDIEKVTTAIEELEKIVREHQTDTTVHIDPHRDEKKWDDLKSEIFRRFDGVDGKIDKLMIIHRPQGPLV